VGRGVKRALPGTLTSLDAPTRPTIP